MNAEVTKTEATILLKAAARADAQVVIPERPKPVTQQRLVGKLLAQKLIRDGQRKEAGYVIARAGYRAVGLRHLASVRASASGARHEAVAHPWSHAAVGGSEPH